MLIIWRKTFFRKTAYLLTSLLKDGTVLKMVLKHISVLVVKLEALVNVLVAINIPLEWGEGQIHNQEISPQTPQQLSAIIFALSKKKSYNTGETHRGLRKIRSQLDQVCTKHACPVQCESHTLQNFRLISFPSFLIKSRKMLDIGSRPLEIRLNNIYMRPRSKKEERGSRQWQCILIVENDDGGCPNSTLKRNVAEIENFISD